MNQITRMNDFMVGPNKLHTSEGFVFSSRWFIRANLYLTTTVGPTSPKSQCWPHKRVIPLYLRTLVSNDPYVVPTAIFRPLHCCSTTIHQRWASVGISLATKATMPTLPQRWSNRLRSLGRYTQQFFFGLILVVQHAII